MTGILEWIVNEASRGLDEGDVREALTTIKWRLKDALRAGTLGDRMIDGSYQRELKAHAAALADSFPEANLSNYTDDDVSALNSWGFEVVDALRAAARAAPSSRDDTIEECARLIAPEGPRPCDCERCYCQNPGDAEAVAAWDAGAANAKKIRSLSTAVAPK